MQTFLEILVCPLGNSEGYTCYRCDNRRIGYKNVKGFQFTRCAIENVKILCSRLTQKVRPEHISLFFCEDIESVFSFINEKISSCLLVQERNKVNGKASNAYREKNKQYQANVAIQCCNVEYLKKLRGNTESNKTKYGTNAIMSYREFQEIENTLDDFHFCHLLMANGA